MPIYDYACSCGNIEEKIARPGEKSLPCRCGGVMERQFHPHYGINMGAAGAYGYFDESLGCFIRTNAHRKQVMQGQGVSEKIGKGWY